ncbi:MAG: PAS domain S-box protein [Nitrospinae bacterium]|nr:PAS domain S-box protein [Nitrospinota bacterium]
MEAIVMSPKKLIITGLLVALAISILIYQLASGLNSRVAFARKELLGLEYIKPLVKFIEHTQRHRGIMNGYLSGEISLKNEAIAELKEIEETIRQIDLIDFRIGRHLDASIRWAELKAKWRRLQGDALNISQEESFNRHTEVIAGTVAIIYHVADTSNLALDPDLGSNHIKEIVVTHLPTLIECLGQMRAKSTGALASGRINEAGKMHLAILESKAIAALDGVSHHLSEAVDVAPGLSLKLGNLSKDIAETTADALGLVRGRILASMFDLTPLEFFNQISVPIRNGFKLHALSISALEEMLGSRIRRLTREMYFAVGAAMSGTGLLVYLGIWSYISVMNGIRRLELSSKELSEVNKKLEYDIIERMKVEERLIESEMLSRSILEGAGDGIITINGHGIIESFNPAASDIFNYSPDEVKGNGISMLFSEPGKDANGYLADYLAGEGKGISMLETVAVRKDGSVFPAELAASKIDIPMKSLYTIVLRDISERNRVTLMERHNRELKREVEERLRIEERLKKSLERERELNQMKSRFVSIVSHEFRTPLSIIASSTELIEKHRDRVSGEKFSVYIQRIKSSNSRMVELMDDVLMIGRYSEGKVEFNPAPLHLRKFCENLVESIQFQIKSGHIITFNGSNCPYGAVMDEKLLRQMLINLLNNAVKYSPDMHGVLLDVYGEGDEVLFIVSDKGIGIPEESIGHLFEPFHRAGNTGTIQGTGLGLAIVKNAVDAHKGKIEVKSLVGSGTVFKIRLQLKNAEVVENA